MALTQPNTPVYYLDSMVSLLATGIYTVTRSMASTYVNGVEVPDPSPVTFQIQAVVNPIGAETLKRFPEARRTTDFRQIFVSVDLHTNNDADGADLIQIGSSVFEVQDSDPYSLMGNIWIVVAQRTNRLNAVAPQG